MQPTYFDYYSNFDYVFILYIFIENNERFNQTGHIGHTFSQFSQFQCFFEFNLKKINESVFNFNRSSVVTVDYGSMPIAEHLAMDRTQFDKVKNGNPETPLMQMKSLKCAQPLVEKDLFQFSIHLESLGHITWKLKYIF